MSWMRTAARSDAHSSQAKEAILANVHRGLLLATASRRLQDSISSPRASAEGRQLLEAAKKLCDATPDLDAHDGRIRVAIAALAQALESDLD